MSSDPDVDCGSHSVGGRLLLMRYRVTSNPPSLQHQTYCAVAYRSQLIHAPGHDGDSFGDGPWDDIGGWQLWRSAMQIYMFEAPVLMPPTVGNLGNLPLVYRSSPPYLSLCYSSMRSHPAMNCRPVEKIRKNWHCKARYLIISSNFTMKFIICFISNFRRKKVRFKGGRILPS